MNEKDKSKSGSLKIGTSAIGCIVALFGLLCAVSFSSAQTDPAPVPDDSQIPGGGAFNLKVAALGSDGEPAQGLEEADAPTSVSSFYEEPDAGSATASTGGIFDEKKVAVPDAAEGKTILDAMHEIARSAGKTLSLLGTNGLERLSEPYVRSDKLESENFRTLLGELLPDDTVDIWDDPDSRFVYLGLSDDVSAKHTQSDVQKLARNHTRIHLAVKDKTLYDVVLMIADASKANILTSYMEKSDQVTDDREENDEAAPIAVDQLGTDAAPAKTEGVRRVTYRTQDEAEWRTVLRSVLEPDYTFDEKDGMVRVATKEKFRQLEAEDRNSIKMEMRYVRVYHANPEDIVARLAEMHVMENDGAKIQVAPYQEKAKKDNVNGFRHTLASSSTSLSTGNTTIGDSASVSSGSWGNLLRPKNPPAILLYDNPGNLDKIESLIRSMDVREKQVLIEALILDLSDDGKEKLGVKINDMAFGAPLTVPFFGMRYERNYESGGGSHTTDNWSGGKDLSSVHTSNRNVKRNWGDSRSDSSELVSTWNKSDIRDNSSSWKATATDNFKGTYQRDHERKRDHKFTSVVGPLDFKFVLEMVREDGDSKLLSSPVLTIGDHSEAMIHVGDVTPILNLKVNTAANTTGAVLVEDVEWQELVTGILMWVGPEVTEDGKSVRLWIHPKISEKSGTGAEYRGTTYPSLTSQELDTRVTVPSGSTLLMGGLTRVQKSESITKVPILGDIPFLGRLFRHTETRDDQRNLVILIRPTILDDETPETGFEAPAMKIVDPLMQNSGRNLKDVVFDDETDAMRRREKKIKTSIREKFFGRKAEDAEVEVSEGEAPETQEEDAAEPEAEPATVTVTVFEADE